MEQKVVIFGLDGILIDTKFGVSKDILTILGRAKEVSQQEEEYQRQKNTGPWGLEQLFILFKGINRERMNSLASRYCDEHLMTGAGETIADLKMNDFLVGVISAEADFAVKIVENSLSLDFSLGSVLEYENKICTGKVLEKVDRYRKAELLKELMEKKGLKKENVIVVGKSVADLPMGEVAGTFIGFRPEIEIKHKVNFVVTDNDLEKILPLVNL
jgi:phosphoserine phosphatase